MQKKSSLSLYVAKSLNRQKNYQLFGRNKWHLKWHFSPSFFRDFCAQKRFPFLKQRKLTNKVRIFLIFKVCVSQMAGMMTSEGMLHSQHTQGSVP